MDRAPALENDLILSMLPASQGGRRVAVGVVLGGLALFLAAVPFAKLPLAQVPAFMPFYQSALIIIDAITALLLFSQARVAGSRAMLVLACGYVFAGLITLAHLLTFPAVFSATGLLGAGPQSTAWMYMFWHGGFPLVVLVYALLKGDARKPVVVNRNSIMAGLLAAALAAAGFTLLATAGHALLPEVILQNRFTPAMIYVVATVWALAAIAAVVLWLRRPHFVLDLWLMVVMSAWVFEMGLAGVFNGGRYDLGFYAGRVFGLLAASLVLKMLLYEQVMMYSRLLEARARERSNIEEIGVANADIAARKRAEEDLRRNEWRLRYATDSARLTYVEADLVGGGARTAENFRSVMGYTPPPGQEADIAVGTRMLLEHVVPEDRPLVEASHEEFFAGKSAGKLEYRVLGDDQVERWIETRWSVELGPDGRPLKSFATNLDITERQSAAKALRESEERFRTLAAMSSDWYWQQDEHFRFVDISEGVESRARTQRATYIGKTRWELPHAGVSEEQWAEHRMLLQRHEPFRDFEYQRITERGETIWVSASGDPVFGADGRFMGYRGTGANITKRKEAEEASREADRRKEFLLTLSDALQPLVDPQEIQVLAADLLGEHLQVNQANYGEVRGEYVHISHSYADGLAPMVGTFHPDDFGKRLIDGHRAGRLQVCVNTTSDPLFDEEERKALAAVHVGAYVAVPLVKEGVWVGVLSVLSIQPRNWAPTEVEAVQEVAQRTWAAVERTRAERALSRSEEKYRSLFESSRELLRRLATVEEDERRAIHREMHDRIGQDLASAKLNIDLARSTASGVAATGTRLEIARDLVQNAIDNSRDIMAELRPPGLDEHGLAVALDLYAEDVAKRLSISVTVHGIELEQRLPRLVETTFFRITQEAISNLAKHASAREVDISLREEAQEVRLTIADDGSGFDVTALPEAGRYGFQIMRERAEAVDARLEIESTPGRGTRIAVILERTA